MGGAYWVQRVRDLLYLIQRRRSVEVKGRSDKKLCHHENGGTERFIEVAMRVPHIRKLSATPSSSPKDVVKGGIFTPNLARLDNLRFISNSRVRTQSRSDS